MTDSETAYLLNRAKEEAIAAIRAKHPSASAAHQRMSMLYSAKAIMELGEDEQEEAAAEPPRSVEPARP